MKLHADPITVNCRKVIAGLDLIGAEYELVHVDYFKAEQRSPAYVALNPNASLPTLVDGDFVLWESNAILQYAADKVGAATCYPTDLRVRSDINRWLLWEAAHWFPSCYVYMVENCVKPLLQAEPDLAALEAQDATFHKLAAILDARLATSRWIAGPNPTIADIALAAPSHLHPYQKLPLDPHPNLRRWMIEGVEKLPCWERSFVGEGFTRERKAA
ncbi:MAG TPA: glutathione S-transferase family protein [Rhodopila sp.]|jgi:glutathione S-transferase